MRISRHKLNSLVLASGLLLALQLATVVWADVIISPESIEAKVKNYILESTTLDDADATLQVEALRLPSAPITLKGGEAEFLLEDSRSTPLTFRTIVQVTISTDEETRHIGVPVRLSIEKPVWVAKRFIRSKENITAKDVILQHKRMDYDAFYALGSKEDITTYSSRTNITPGSIIDLRKVVNTPAVYQNDDINLILTTASGVNIKVYGKALENGAIGKRIRVCQQLVNRKNRFYVGEVVSKNTVIVRI